MIKEYYKLTKPGIIYGNLLPAIAGFFFASHGTIDVRLLIATLLGLALVIACGCVINNYLDRGIDAAMERTKNRALVTGAISNSQAVFFAGVLGGVGFSLLLLRVNTAAALVALFGVIVYLCLYTPAKTRTPYAAEIGSFAGAVPPLLGYVAVSNAITLPAMLLFAILVLWQMPHFFAISIYRKGEYAKANIPLLSITHGVYRTKIHILIYIVFLAAPYFLCGISGIRICCTSLV